MSGSNQPTYNSVGQLPSEKAAAIKSIIDVKSAFEGASWDLVTEGKEIVYFTEDIEVMAAAAFLTEDLENVPASVEVSIKATSSSANPLGLILNSLIKSSLDVLHKWPYISSIDMYIPPSLLYV